MKKLAMAVFVLVMALGLSVDSAEAARLGGGKSVGIQRQSVAPKPVVPKPAAPAQQAAPSVPAAAPAAVPAAPKRNWMGPLAGLAAGLGIGALLSSFGVGSGMGGGLGSILMMVLLAVAAFFVFKLFRRRIPATQAADPMQLAGSGYTSTGVPLRVPDPPFASPAPPVTPVINRVPENFDSTGFLRIAKVNFVRLQAANDTKNLDDIREFVSPEVFAEIKMQIDERGNVLQQTDVVTLNAELIEVTTEENRHFASVHFSGTIRELVGAPAVTFDEIWNLTKPVQGGQGWIIAGIQQVS